VSGDGGDVSISAADAIVGSINANGSTDPTRLHLLGQSDGFVYTLPFKGGDVTVKTDIPLRSGAITSEGVQKGKVAIGQRDTLPTGVSSSDITIELQDLPAFASSKNANQVRQNVLNLWLLGA
jgi:hypothetical protein